MLSRDLAMALAGKSANTSGRNTSLAGRAGASALKMLAVLVVSAAAAVAVSGQSARETVVKIVAQIQRADYEGDRAALKRLYGELTPFVEDKELASRVRYWPGICAVAEGDKRG